MVDRKDIMVETFVDTWDREESNMREFGLASLNNNTSIYTKIISANQKN